MVKEGSRLARGSWKTMEISRPRIRRNSSKSMSSRSRPLKRMDPPTIWAGGENQVAQSANVDFVYSELWGNNPNYNSFNQRVNNVRSYCSKGLVMPAYMDTGL